MKHFLKIFFCFSIILVSASAGKAQIQVYRGNGQVITEQVLHFANHRIFPGYSFNFSDVLYTVFGNKIMAGGTGSEFDLVYTFRDGKLYSGTAMYTSQIAYTIANGKIYKGDSTFPLDILYTVKDGVIYAGNQVFSMDALFVVAGAPTATELFAILMSLDLIS